MKQQWKKAKLLLGIDVGDSQIHVAAMRKTTMGWQKEKVVLTADGQVSLPVCICYGPTGKPRVGWETALDPDGIFGFRVSPETWRFLIGGVGRCWGAVLCDYVSQIWKLLMRNNLFLAEAVRKKNLLVVVNYPDEWGTKHEVQYLQMLRYAIRYEAVALYPWLGAILLYLEKKKAFVPNCGFTVWQFGYDLNYFCVGKDWLPEHERFRMNRKDVRLTSVWIPPGTDPAWVTYYAKRFPNQDTEERKSFCQPVCLVGPFGDTPEVAQIARNAYPGSTIWQEKPPYTGAAEGLCLAGIRKEKEGHSRNRATFVSWFQLKPKDDDEWEGYYE